MTRDPSSSTAVTLAWRPRPVLGNRMSALSAREPRRVMSQCVWIQFGSKRWDTRTEPAELLIVPVARRSVNGPAYALVVVLDARAPAPDGALVSCSGVTERSTARGPPARRARGGR